MVCPPQLGSHKQTIDAMDHTILDHDIEHIAACPLCAGTQLKQVSEVRTPATPAILSTAMCGGCGFVFRDRRPQKEWFSRAFADREAFQKQHGINALNPAIEAERYRRYFLLGSAIAKRAQAIGGLGQVLDIGCGPGTGLKALQDAGFRATGVEEDRTRADHGLSLGLDIIPEQWEKFSPKVGYEVITCLHSIEHFHDPQSLLTKLRSWLKPGGLLVIEVPNLRHFVADWTDALYLAHMANYSPRALVQLGRNAGFVAVERLRYYEAPAKNDENLCLAFRIAGGEGAPELKPGPDDEISWEWLAKTYGTGLEGGHTLPYVFEVPTINDVSLSYKNSSKISADLKENLHMRRPEWDDARSLYRIR